MNLQDATIEQLQAQIDRLEAMADREENPPILFYGVAPRERAGHFIYHPWYVMTSRSCEYLAMVAGRPNSPGLYPWRGYKDRALGPETQGRFWHWKGDGVTAIMSWDRSADSRGNCCASFLVIGDVSPARALERAREVFPGVFKRIEAYLGVPVELAGACPYT